MVYVNLSKLLQLVVAVTGCPYEVPKREEKLIAAYLGLTASSEHQVSVAVDPKFERIREISIDEEKMDIRKLILTDIINQYTESKLDVPKKNEKVYLISPLSSCLFCDGNMVVVKSRHGGKKAVVYTTTGGVNAFAYMKHCSKCCACAFPSYIETVTEPELKRKYLNNNLFTCYSRFSFIVEKYNRLFKNIPLLKKRLIDAYLIYAINTRLGGIQFPVVRDKFRNINIEDTCKFLYPQLRSSVDSKWKRHQCSLCSTRIGNC